MAAIARIVGISSSGIFAGYTWSLSHAAVPAILKADEKTQAAQWRVQYLSGFAVAIPCTIMNVLSWSWLLYHARDAIAKNLFIVALLCTGSGTVFAWTVLRHLNGGLAIRSEKLLGPSKHMALTYSIREDASVRLEKGKTTEELVRKWMNFNMFRAAILMLGTVAGSIGLVMDASPELLR